MLSFISLSLFLEFFLNFSSKRLKSPKIISFSCSFFFRKLIGLEMVLLSRLVASLNPYFATTFAASLAFSFLERCWSISSLSTSFIFLAFSCLTILWNISGYWHSNRASWSILFFSFSFISTISEFRNSKMTSET